MNEGARRGLSFLPKLLLGLLLPIGLIAYLVHVVIRSASSVPASAWQFDLRFLLLSFVCGILAYIQSPIVFKLGLRCFLPQSSYRTAFVVMHLSGLLKYIPGKIWQFAGAIFISKTRRIGTSRAVAAIAMTQLLSVLSGFALSSAIVVSGALGHLPALVRGLLAALLLCSTLAVYPPFFRRVYLFSLRLMGQQAEEPSYGGRTLLAIFFHCCITWVLTGLSFSFLARAFHQIPFRDLPVVADKFIATYVLGYVAFFTPGGLGVREAALTYLLCDEMPYAISAAVSLISRIWIIALEALFALVALLLARRSN